MKRMLLFVHYNKKGQLDDRVIYTLEKIKHLFDSIVMISNSPLSSDNQDKLKHLSVKVIVRDNIGYDFSAWKEGMEKVGWVELKKYDSLTLMNDTCHFPIRPIDKYYAKFEKDNNVDFWGATIHRKTTSGMPGTNGPVPDHIQSYFMSFKTKVFMSEPFIGFWNGLKAHNNVQQVIREYETQLTGLLTAAGFKYTAIVNSHNRVFSKKEIVNPIYQTPDLLLKQGFPFIKLKSVTKLNFLNIRGLLKTKSSYPENYINAYNTNRLLQSALLAIFYIFRRPHLAFLAISVPSIIAFSLITPLGFGGDEAAHVYKSYNISQGHLFNVAGEVPKNIYDTMDYGWSLASRAAWGTNFYHRQDLNDQDTEHLRQLGERKINPSVTTSVTFYNGASYPATVYAGAIFGFWLGEALDLSVHDTIIVARLLNAIPYLVLGAVSIYILRRSMARWIVFTVLLVPTVISYAATINGDPYNIAAVTLFFAIFLQCINSHRKITKKYLILLSVSSLLIALAKLPSVLLVGLLFFIQKDRFSSARDKWMKVCLIATVACLLALTITQIGYEHLPYRAASSDKISWALSNPVETMLIFLRSVFLDSPDYINRALGVMGRNGVFVHQNIITMIIIWFTVLALSVDTLSKKKGLLLLSFAGIICIVVIGLLFTGDPGNTIGELTVWGVHGKYFTPFIPMIVYGLGALIPFKIIPNKNYVGALTILLMTFTTITSLITYLLALY